MIVIKTNNLSKQFRVYEKPAGLIGSLKSLFNNKFKEIHAVENINLEIHEGEIVGFLGPNGAGKTTTLKMLSGLLFPTNGNATVLGYVPWERPVEFRKAFSLVMGQKSQLWWDLPASDSFELHKEIYKIDPVKFKKNVGELTEIFQVANLLNKPVRELSLGERMKLELIASLLHDPKLLLLDEPTIGLDVVAQSAMHRCLYEFNQTRKITILLTSHYMRDVETLCSRILVISGGKMVYDGQLQGLKDEFGKEKLIKIQFKNLVPDQVFSKFEQLEITGGIVRLRVSKNDVPSVLAVVSQCEEVLDISIEDPPIEEVIEKLFVSHRSKSL
ncbi:MAG: ATP-binding cassette domain-containing protein [Planctomycetota bacterium]|nr:ATP-binding cassette domain-containing protein [Planctomycetota bacterium]